MENADTMQWLIGILITVGITICGAFISMYGRISSVERDFGERLDGAKSDAIEADGKIWQAHHEHVRETSAFREDIKLRIGALATRDDIDRLRRDMSDQQRQILTELTRISDGRFASENARRSSGDR
jgi:hypothetical protein